MSKYAKRRRFGIIGDRRVILSAVGMVALAATVTMQPLSSDAASRDRTGQASDRETQVRTSDDGQSEDRPEEGGDGNRTAAGSEGQAGTEDGSGSGTDASGSANPSDSADPVAAAGVESAPAEGVDPGSGSPADSEQAQAAAAPAAGQQAADGDTSAAQGLLGDDCQNSRLEPHDGFQNGNRCVSTAFGEVAGAERNPSLVIASAPRVVRANRSFSLRVSTRNLIRDRFLAAAQGGYYKESSFLNEDGVVRGHFHTACRMLSNRRDAPDPAPAPVFFAATEDGGGGRSPDTVTVRVAGLPSGLAQCAVWAGDGSHRVPMMQRANQIPAFDVVRITVR